MLIGQIQEQLIEEEGIRLVIYKDIKGYLTGGVGHRIFDENLHEGDYVSLSMVADWLNEDLLNTMQGLERNIPFYGELDDKRQYVLISMCFNLGISGLMKFKKMLLALEQKNYELAAQEMKNSLWHSQVKSRALKLENIMRTGCLI